MSRQVLLAIGGGGTSAILAIAVVVGSPAMLVLANFAPLPLFLVGLSAGAGAGTVASVVGLAVAGLLGGTLAALMYGLFHALPALVVTQQALVHRTVAGHHQWRPAGHVLSALTVMVAGILVVGGPFAVHGSGGVVGAVSNYLDAVFSTLMPSMTADDRNFVVQGMVPTFPAVVGIAWVMAVAANGMIAQAVLQKSGQNRRPAGSLSDHSVPDWMSWLLVGAAVVALVATGDARYVARNLVMILAVPFFVMGLTVVHALARRTPATGAVLILCYMVLFFSGWARLAVTAIGVIEAWVGIRKRLGGPPAKRENE